MDSSTRISDLPENITIQMTDSHGNQPGLPPSFPTFQDMQLPSRDIRVDASQFRDEATKVNYIPPPPTTTDYVREYEDKKKQFKEHNEQKHRVQLADDVFSELQMPILIAILFFIFQMPIINKLMSTLSFLPIYRTDGNANVYGVMLKSAMFGSMFYSIHKVIQMI